MITMRPSPAPRWRSRPARSAAVTSSRWASRWCAGFPSQERDKPDGCDGIRWSAAKEDSAVTEAAIAGHRLELTRATCVGPVRVRCGRPAAGERLERGPAGVRPAGVRPAGRTEAAVLNSSLLPMSSVGFVSLRPDEACTLAAMNGQLISDSLVYRYDPPRPPTTCRAPRAPSRSARSSTSTRLPGRAGWRTRLAFEKMLTYANHLGLYSEEITLSQCAGWQSRTGVSPTSPCGRRDHPRRGPRSANLPMTARARMRSGLAASSPRSPTGSRGR
jgi:hypothetical protein